jgi:uncharacterized membrane protein (DUF4010 family)
MMPNTLLSFTMSLLIGLLLGIEREQSHPEGSQFIGVRTFSLLAILGTLVATLHQTILIFTVSAFVFFLLCFNYVRTNRRHLNKLDGIVTELCAAITFCLGFMVTLSPMIAMEITAIILLILIERKRLHALAREKFKPHEMEAVIIIIIFALGVLPLLPNRTIDPWQLFNPRNFGLLITTIAAIQFISYVAIHMFRERFGMALTGFLGGLVSSTIVFARLPDMLRQYPGFVLALLASGLLATVAMFVDIAAIIFVASPTLLLKVIWPILAMMMTGLVMSIILIRLQQVNTNLPPVVSNPLDLFAVMRNALFLGLMIILIGAAKYYLTTKGILVTSFLGGLVEIHGITLGTVLLYMEQQISMHDAKLILYAAILASFVSKFFLLWSLSPNRFALQLSLLLLIMMTSGGLVFWLISS